MVYSPNQIPSPTLDPQSMMLFPRDPGKVDARSSNRTIVRLEGSRVRISKLARQEQNKKRVSDLDGRLSDCNCGVSEEELEGQELKLPYRFGDTSVGPDTDRIQS